MKNILIAAIALIIFPASLTSQNEKLWELELDDYVQLLDAEFFTDTSYITLEIIDSANGKGGYNYNWYLKTRDLFTNEEIDSINFKYNVNSNIDVSIKDKLFFIVRWNIAYLYNYNFEIIDSVEMYQQLPPGSSAYTYFTVDWDNEKFYSVHTLRFNNWPYNNIELKAFDLKTKMLTDSLKIEQVSYSASGLKLSNNKNYLATIFSDSTDKLKLFSSTDFGEVHTFEIPIWNGIKDYSFSPNNEYLIFTADTNVVNTVDLHSKEIIGRDSINKQFNYLSACSFLSDEYVLIAGMDKNDMSTGIVYSYPGFEIVHKYENRFGDFEININSESNLILSNTSSLITLSRFDPNALTVESERENISATIYPNPVTDNANININISSPGKYNYTIVDISGRIVKESQKRYFGEGEHNLEIDMSNFLQGVYFLNFYPSIGKTIKIIKDK